VPAPLTVTAEVADGGALSYQWFENVSNSSAGGTPIEGETADTYTPSADNRGIFYYYVVVANTNPSVSGSQTAEAASEAAVITVNAPTDAEAPNISAHPEGGAYHISDPLTLSVTVGVNDGGALSYKWYKNKTNSNEGGSLIAATPTYSVPTGTEGTFYYYVVIINTNSAANGAKSAVAKSEVAAVTITRIVNAQSPAITGHPSDMTRNEGDSASLNVYATVTDSGKLSYQWYKNTSNSVIGGTPIEGATTALCKVDTSRGGTSYYYVVVTNTNTGVNGSQTAVSISSAAAVTIIGTIYIDAQTPVITAQPRSEAITKDTAASLSVTAGVTDSGTLSYQWYKNTSANNTNGTALTGETADTYTLPTDTDGTFYYYVVVTNTNNGVNGYKTAARTSIAAVITIVNYTVAHTANFYVSGNLANVMPVSAAGNITLPTPTPILGYTFDGWYIDNGGSAEVSPYNLSADTDFYAKWLPGGAPTDKVKAVFYDDGIEVASIEEYPVNHITLPAGVTRNRYTFNGWKPEGSAVAADPIFTISANTKFDSDFELDASCTEINNATDLAAIRTGLSGCYKLMSHIDFGNAGWTPVGTNSTPFTGVFEGNEKTVRNINIGSSSTTYSGFFGYLSGGARVANLTVDVVQAGVTGSTNTGGIAGYAVGTSGSPTKIINSHIKATSGTASTKVKGTQNVGGILGAAAGYVTINGCSNEVPVEATSRGGGILGYIANIITENRIYNSRNSATVKVTGIGYLYSGGIVGYIWSASPTNIVVNSHNTGGISVLGTNNDQEKVGHAGGITGRGGVISTSGNTGNVIAEGYLSDDDYNGAVYVGGISGYASVSSVAACISGSYNEGTVTAKSQQVSFNNGAPSYAGGIAGYQAANSSILNNYNKGDVAASTSSSPLAYAGGIVGYQAGTVSMNYNTGDVSATTGSGAVYAAGIVGYRSGTPAVSNNAAANESVTGTTTSMTKKVNRVVAGGNSASNANLTAITGNIALDSMTGNVPFESESAYLGADTDEDDFKTRAAYESIGWLFGNDADRPWKIPAPDGTDYPLLYWQ
jgi:uncharacterized repeat protein (TIGR02543 family)